MATLKKATELYAKHSTPNRVAGAAALVLVLGWLATRSKGWFLRTFFRSIYGFFYKFGPPKSLRVDHTLDPPSRQTLALASIFHLLARPWGLPVKLRRFHLDSLEALQTPHPKVRLEQPFHIPHAYKDEQSPMDRILIYKYVPDQANGKIIVFVHGGGYTCGSQRSHGRAAGQLAGLSQRTTYFIEYSLGPEVPVPGGVNEVTAFWEWLLRSSIKPQDVVFAGDSAGGGLILLSVIKFQKLGLPMPGGLLLWSPWCDVSNQNPTWSTNQDVILPKNPYKVGTDTLQDATGLYRPSLEQLRSPTISPYYEAEVSFLPPVLFQAGTAEALLDDSRLMHQKLTAAGVSSTLELYEHQQHDFQLFYDWLDQSLPAMQSSVTWMNSLP